MMKSRDDEDPLQHRAHATKPSMGRDTRHTREGERQYNQAALALLTKMPASINPTPYCVDRLCIRRPGA